MNSKALKAQRRWVGFYTGLVIALGALTWASASSSEPDRMGTSFNLLMFAIFSGVLMYNLLTYIEMFCGKTVEDDQEDTEQTDEVEVT